MGNRSLTPARVFFVSFWLLGSPQLYHQTFVVVSPSEQSYTFRRLPSVSLIVKMNADGNVENAPPNESRIVRTLMSDHRNLVYEFGRFELIPSEYRLQCDGQPIPLDKRPFDLLVVFAERPGQLLKYDELLDLVWGPNSEVYRNALQVAKAVLHSILGE